MALTILHRHSDPFSYMEPKPSIDSMIKIAYSHNK